MQKQLFGIDKIPEADLRLYERIDENRVRVKEDGSIRELPFFVRLNEYRIEYYEPANSCSGAATGGAGGCPPKRDGPSR